MIEKIISGGRTGADRAALDFAIKQKIPHGGWGPKGRLAEDGNLPRKYKLAESPTTSYQRRAEQNVIGSDGTLIVSHGRLTGGAAYTKTMAKKHNRPVLHVDFNKHAVLQASLEIQTWLDDNNIKVLNVTGPRASKNSMIYKGVQDVLENLLIFESKRDRIFGSFQFSKVPAIKKIKWPETVDEAVDRLRSEMKLKVLVTLAKVAEDDLVNLHFTVGMWIQNNFMYPRNEKLLESCRKVSGDRYLRFTQMHMVIIRELWKKLQKTHRLQVVR
jgi:hypothetical protein